VVKRPRFRLKILDLGLGAPPQKERREDTSGTQNFRPIGVNIAEIFVTKKVDTETANSVHGG